MATRILVWRGRGLTARFLVAVGDDDEWLVDVQAGRCRQRGKGAVAVLSTSWTFALKGTLVPVGDRFWQPVPPPITRIFSAWLRQGELRMEGDLLPLWRDMMYIKGLLATLRGNGTPA